MRIETSDIVLASTLRSKGFPLEKIVKHRAKGIFVFAEIPAEVISDFGLGKILVEPTTFNNYIKSLTQAVRQQPIEELHPKNVDDLGQL